MQLKGKVVWVVGASSGIGAAVARELACRGAVVAISARRKDELNEVAGAAGTAGGGGAAGAERSGMSRGSMLVVPADVTDAASMTDAATLIRDELGPIDIAVLSAGYWRQTSAARWDTEVFNRHVQVNLVGMSNAIAAVLPQMLAGRRGVIAGISSVAGYRGLAGSEAYGATKAGQINLLESLRIHVARDGVRVVTICPGFVRTELTGSNAFPMPFIIEADTAGRAICDGLERERTEIVFPVPMAILMKAARLVPVRLWSAMWSHARPTEGAT